MNVMYSGNGNLTQILPKRSDGAQTALAQTGEKLRASMAALPKSTLVRHPSSGGSSRVGQIPGTMSICGDLIA